MTDASQRLDFLKYRGRTFVEIAGLSLWLLKHVDKAMREGDTEAASVLRAIVVRIEEDAP